MNRTISTVGLLAAAAMACSQTVPASRVASAETAVQLARQGGAASIPNANNQLAIAEDEIVQAKNLNDKRNGDAAEAMLVRAEADAALAAALANEAQHKARLEVPNRGTEDATRAKQAPQQGR
jgi:hypothetical protein